MSPGSRIVGSGIMAERVRAFHWAVTPLGAIEHWSETLTSAVNQVLSTPLPATLSWGEQLTFFYNDATIPTLADKHPDALGRSYRDVFREAWHLVGPDMEACLRLGVTTVRENVYIPILKGGQAEAHYWTYSLIPLHEDGRIAGVFDPYQNTTAMVRAAQERDAAIEQLGQFLGATTDAVVGVNRKWQISYLNTTAETTYGLDRDLIGKNLWEEFPDAVYEGSPFVEHYTRAMDQKISGSFEAHYPDPLNIWIQLEVYPTSEGLVTFSRDISELKKATAALLQNEKLAAVGRLAASIAHEINNPLESVTNLLYLVQGTDQLPEIRGYVDTAERELRRVSLITNQTLRFHRQSTRPTPAFCYDLIGDSLSIFQGRLVNNRVEVEKRKRAEHPVGCFEGEIRQVLSNLIGNAIDAMPAGGRLLVRSREGHDWTTGALGVVLTVADTGSGMSREVQAKIFDAFYSTKGIGGTGLGLWISKEIAAQHAGTLRVRSSQCPGRSGTVFTLFLPFEAATR